MKFFRNSLRVLIAGSSALAFFGGWAIFAHTEKPAPAVQPMTPISAPAPLNFRPLEPSGNLQPLPVLPPSRSAVVPRLRTRSS